MKNRIFSFLFLLLAFSQLNAQTGCVSGDCNENSGTYVYENGANYVGSWKGGTFDGFGTFTWESGDKYTGEWKNGLQNGNGTYIYLDGREVKGKWINGEYQSSSNQLEAKAGCISGDCKNGNGTYVWENGDKYTGEWENERFNGRGKYTFANGEIYDGNWKNHLRNGYGKNTYASGEIKEGIWEEDRFVGEATNYTGCISGDCDNGYGVYVWSDGEKFEGNWINKKRNGFGKNTWSSGAYYEGYFKDDNKDGEGSYYYTNGEIKTGFWENNKFIGKKTGCISGDCNNDYGVYVWEDGDRYEGFWKEGKLEGEGSYLYSGGKQKYVGEFLNGKFNGKGTFYYADGRIKDGLWENDIFIGANLNKTGCISGDCSNGRGVFIWETGEKYEGQFVNNKMEGNGVLYHPNGDYYTGEWKNGNYEGFGKYVKVDGTIQEGNWKESKFIAKTNIQTKASLSWTFPATNNIDVNEEEYQIKLCVNSESPIKNTKITVNGVVQVNTTTRGLLIVESECSSTINKQIKLSPGKNTINVEIENEAGVSKAESREINYIIENPTSIPKIALIIGNQNYIKSPLKNPINDANAMAEELKKLGFDVLLYKDLSLVDMKLKIREFGNKLAEKNTIGLFYYAGHGMQVNGINYLIPVNANIQKEQDIEFEALNLARVTGEMAYAKNDLNILILDACRDNPFSNGFRSTANKGLAALKTPIGSFVAYATSPGDVAIDGEGVNGLYTQELLKALKIPGLKIEDVFKEVRKNVYQQSEKRQMPWDNSALIGDFYFNK